MKFKDIIVALCGGPGYDVVFNGTKPRYVPDENKRKRGYPFHEPHSLKSIKSRVEQICDWLENDDVTFVALYLEQPDETAHQTGPDRNDSRLDVKIRQVDSLIGSIRERLKESKLDDQVNIMIMGENSCYALYALIVGEKAF